MSGDGFRVDAGGHEAALLDAAPEGAVAGAAIDLARLEDELRRLGGRVAALEATATAQATAIARLQKHAHSHEAGRETTVRTTARDWCDVPKVGVDLCEDTFQHAHAIRHLHHRVARLDGGAAVPVAVDECGVAGGTTPPTDPAKWEAMRGYWWSQAETLGDYLPEESEVGSPPAGWPRLLIDGHDYSGMYEGLRPRRSEDGEADYLLIDGVPEASRLALRLRNAGPREGMAVVVMPAPTQSRHGRFVLTDREPGIALVARGGRVDACLLMRRVDACLLRLDGPGEGGS